METVRKWSFKNQAVIIFHVIQKYLDHKGHGQ